MTKNTAKTDINLELDKTAERLGLGLAFIKKNPETLADNLFKPTKKAFSLPKDKASSERSYSKQESFLKLVEIQQMALETLPKPDFTAALRSEELKGKLFGLYQDKTTASSLKEETFTLTPTALVTFVDK